MNPPPKIHSPQEIMALWRIEGEGFPEPIHALAELTHQALRPHTHPQEPHATPAHILALARRVFDNLACLPNHATPRAEPRNAASPRRDRSRPHRARREASEHRPRLA